MEKKKKLIILGIVLGVVLISGITYAALSWASGKVNIGLTSNCFTINYTGRDINNATINLLNESDLISDNKFTIKGGIALTFANIGIKSSCTIEGYGSLYLNIASLSDAFTTGNSKGALKYAILKNTSPVKNISISTLKDQSFDIVKNDSITEIGQIKLLTTQLSNTSVNKYLIVIYIDNSLTGNDVIGATFNGYISADANQGSVAKETLTTLNLSSSSGIPDFTKTSTTDGTNGIYGAEDDFGPSYYFRGNVTNNYVKFADKYWRIIRINGDGSIRMIYSGTSAHANGYDDSGTNDMSIGTSAFNSSSNDNTYVGYMYGTAGASTYEETHSNTTNSTIKTVLDSWYDTNIVNTGNEKYIADAIYCNDRNVNNDNGKGTERTSYGAVLRIDYKGPTLKCTNNYKITNNNDKFTKSATIGNGKLTKMIGLITSDEVMYAGGKSGTINKEYYLYSGANYWTMTPYRFWDNGAALVIYVNKSGDFDWLGEVGMESVESSHTIRPVISLKSDAISSGSGTMTDPFTVG